MAKMYLSSIVNALVYVQMAESLFVVMVRILLSKKKKCFLTFYRVTTDLGKLCHIYLLKYL